jgi:cytoskeletal protein RodZ
MTNWSDIGKALRTTRESRGFSIHDVSHRTRIPVHTLHELEEGDYSSFPSPAYAKGFLAQYADHLNMDSSEWLDDLEIEQAPLNLQNYEFFDHDQEEAHAPAPSHPQHKHGRSEVESTVRIPSAALQPLAVFIATAMLLSAGVYGFVKLNERLSTVAEEEEVTPAPAPPQVIVKTPRSDGNTRAATSQGNPAAVSRPLATNDPSHPPATLGKDLDQPLAIDTTPPRAVIVEE